MTDENSTRFEQVEQTTQELKEMLLKNHEKHCEQMVSLMEIVLQMTKKKAATESPIPTEIAIGSGIIQEEPLCPPSSTPTHMQPSQRIVLYQILLHLLLRQLKRHVQYLHHL